MASASNFEMALDFYVGNVSCTLDGVEVSEQELKQLFMHFVRHFAGEPNAITLARC